MKNNNFLIMKIFILAITIALTVNFISCSTDMKLAKNEKQIKKVEEPKNENEGHDHKIKPGKNKTEKKKKSMKI